MKFFLPTATAFLIACSLSAYGEPSQPAPVPATSKAIQTPAAAESKPAEQETQPSEASITVELPAPGETRLVGKDEAIGLTKTHGSKLLVINYWATWCAPCLAEMPYFQAAHEKYGSQGVKIVGYSMDYDAYTDDAEKATKSSLKRLGITYPSLSLKVDSNETFPHFSDEWFGGLPATFFYDEKGNKVAEFLGEVSQEELFAKIDSLLADQTPPKSE